MAGQRVSFPQPFSTDIRYSLSEEYSFFSLLLLPELSTTTPSPRIPASTPMKQQLHIPRQQVMSHREYNGDAQLDIPVKWCFLTAQHSTHLSVEAYITRSKAHHNAGPVRTPCGTPVTNKIYDLNSS